jgi:uncharacterized damage-inducible protein DinB
MDVPELAAESLRQVRDGLDFPAPRTILSRISNVDASRIPTGFKYSLITLVEHTAFWQTTWINRLKGKRSLSFMHDWRVPEPNEWPEVRERFLAGLNEALAIAESKPFHHSMKSDEAAIRTILQIAVHDAYHIGQLVTLKRALRGETNERSR